MCRVVRMACPRRAGGREGRGPVGLGIPTENCIERRMWGSGVSKSSTLSGSAQQRSVLYLNFVS